MSESAGKTILRPLREEDAEAVASLYHLAFGDDRPLDAEEIVSWFRNPGFRRDRLQVLEVNEQAVAGYGDIAVTRDVVELDVAAPGHWETFLDWAEESARFENIPLQPPRLDVVRRPPRLDVVRRRSPAGVVEQSSPAVHVLIVAYPANDAIPSATSGGYVPSDGRQSPTGRSGGMGDEARSAARERLGEREPATRP